MVKREISGIVVECVQGDIITQNDMDAIVNAANAQLRIGGGVAGAIHRAAGPGLTEECRPMVPITPGEAVITSGHRLANPHIIHCLGPVYGVDKPENLLLAKCYENALLLADNNELESVAFPAISTGTFGYPMEEAVEVAFNSILNTIPQLMFVRTIRIVLFSNRAFEIHSNHFQLLKIE